MSTISFLQVEMFRYRELIENHKQGYEVLTDRKIDLGEKIIIEAKSSMIIELE